MIGRGASSTKKMLYNTARLAVDSLTGFFNDRAARAEAIAASRAIDVETKLKLLKSLHRQMNLASSFILAVVFSIVGAILLWAIGQNLTTAIVGWAVLVIILFEIFLIVQDRSFKRAVGMNR